MRPFHRTLKTLWIAAGVLVGLAVLLWGSALLGLAVIPDDDGLGTAFLGIYLILLGMVSLAVSLVFVALRSRRETRQGPGRSHTPGA